MKLEPNSIKFKTVRTRIKRNNLNGEQPQCNPIIQSVEPMIAEFCSQLAKMGSPQTRDDVIKLAISFCNTHAIIEKVVEWKKEQKIWKPDQKLVGISWYRGFMKRYKHQI